MQIAFKPNQIASGTEFYGRVNETQALRQRLSDRQSVLITGERRIGKTSLLSHAAQFLDLPPSEHHRLYLDAPAWGSFAQLAYKLNSELTSRKLAGVIPKIRQGPQLDTHNILEALFYNLQEIKTRGREVLVYVNDLDDVLERMAQEPEERIAAKSFLRSIIDSGHLVACATSFLDFSEDRDSVSSAPLFNVFHHIRLGPFTRGEAWDFLADASDRSGDRFIESECNLATTLLGYAPFTLQQFGYNLFAGGVFPGAVGKKRLDQIELAVEKTFHDALPQWRMLLSHLGTERVAVLAAAARGEQLNNNSHCYFLEQRGLIGVRGDLLAPMGTLFGEFLSRLETVEGEGSFSRSFFRAAQAVADSALSTIIQAAMSRLLT